MRWPRIIRALHDIVMVVVRGFVSKLRSFFTTLCPLCRFRRGVRVCPRSKEGFLGWFWLLTFECHGCNRRFRAFSFESRWPETTIRRLSSAWQTRFTVEMPDRNPESHESA